MFEAILRAMRPSAQDSQNAGPVERFKALWDAAEGGNTALPRPRAGVTPCGRYGYRYDDEGRFYAVLLPDAAVELPDRWQLGFPSQ